MFRQLQRAAMVFSILPCIAAGKSGISQVTGSRLNGEGRGMVATFSSDPLDQVERCINSVVRLDVSHRLSLMRADFEN